MLCFASLRLNDLGFMVVFMLCLFIVHSLCRFGCWCYCAGGLVMFAC